MTASDHVSRQQMSMSVIGQMQSGDYGVSMSEVPGNYLTPGNRTHADKQTIAELADDVKDNGVTKPIKVEMGKDRPMVTDGHHRYVAAHMAGVTHVPVTSEWDVDMPLINEWARSVTPTESN